MDAAKRTTKNADVSVHAFENVIEKGQQFVFGCLADLTARQRKMGQRTGKLTQL